MPTPIVIDKAHARRFLLAHLRLLSPRTLQGKQGVLDYLRHVNCIQSDPINVVGQNPHLVLQSRVRKAVGKHDAAPRSAHQSGITGRPSRAAAAASRSSKVANSMSREARRRMSAAASWTASYPRSA